MYGKTDGRTDGRMDGWMDGWMDEWMDGWMDGWMDKLIQVGLDSNLLVLNRKTDISPECRACRI
jgi:hypothetical protein